MSNERVGSCEWGVGGCEWGELVIVNEGVGGHQMGGESVVVNGGVGGC